MLQHIKKLSNYSLVKIFFILHICSNAYASLPQVALDIAGMQEQGKRSSQQDVFYIRPQEKAAEDGYCAGIFDGHGVYGTDIAQQAFTLFFNKFNDCSIVEKDTIEQSLKDIFQYVNDRLKELDILSNGIAQVSGTTALIAYKLGSLLYIAHVGDSRAVWGKNVDEQTVDHTAENQDELKRYDASEYYYDSEDCAYRLDTKPTLEITRGLGDFHASTLKGWSAVPDITVIDLQKYPIVIMGSDGLWHYISTRLSNESVQEDNNTVAYDIAQSNLKSDDGSVKTVCEKLIRAAINSSTNPNIGDYETLNTALDDESFINEYAPSKLGDNTTVVVINSIQVDASPELVKKTVELKKEEKTFLNKNRNMIFLGLLFLCLVGYGYWHYSS
jgi:serine/threonine protein phosphatase PrpC